MRITKEDIDRIYSDLVVGEDADGALGHLVNLFDALDAAVILIRPSEAKLVSCISNEERNYSPEYATLENQKALFELAAGDGISSVFSNDLLGDEYPLGDSSILGVYFNLDDKLVGISLYRSSSYPFSNGEIEIARELKPHLERAVMLLCQKQNLPAVDAKFLDNFGLTKREHEIIEQLKKGLSYPEIQSVLDITHNTLKWHTKNIYQKMQVSTLPALLSLVFTGKKS